MEPKLNITHYVDSVDVVGGAVAELVVEEAMQMVTNPEDEHFCHQQKPLKTQFDHFLISISSK